jgi:predicted ATPase
MLLVADNCDHVLATAARVLGELLAAVPGLQVLATSRQPLGDSAERVLALRPLPLPADLRLNDIQAAPACQLFADRARAAAPGFALDSRSAPHVAAICGQLDGLPLAIELAAARTRSLDIEALADSIASHPALLEQSARTQRHRSLTAAIDWSWQLLDDQERALLSRLSALPAEFPLALAEAAWAGPPAADPRATLLRLADRSLVAVRVGEGEPASYRLLGVIRAFAAAHLPPAEADQVRAAHARYHRDLAARLARRLLGPGPEGGPAGVDAAAGSWRFGAPRSCARRRTARLSRRARRGSADAAGDRDHQADHCGPPGDLERCRAGAGGHSRDLPQPGRCGLARWSEP